jgi:hypothetical protein
MRVKNGLKFRKASAGFRCKLANNRWLARQIPGVFSCYRKMPDSLRSACPFYLFVWASGAGRVTILSRAADEKIPLSMVRVNTKPQHLVFLVQIHARYFWMPGNGLWKTRIAAPGADLRQWNCPESWAESAPRGSCYPTNTSQLQGYADRTPCTRRRGGGNGWLGCADVDNGGRKGRDVGWVPKWAGHSGESRVLV